MTALRPGLRQRAQVGELADCDLAELGLLLDADPLVNAVVSARVRAAGSLQPARLGGTVLGVRRDGVLHGALYNGGNLLPIGGDESDWGALARFVVQRRRTCTAIVGRAEAVAVMWPVLAAGWASARALRPVQPLLRLDDVPSVPGDERVRAARPDELERYLPAAAAMFAEELGVSPHVAPGSAAFRSRVSELLRRGRAFAAFDFRGQVTFKADLAAVTPYTCQIQGVWVRPDLRGQGTATAALATVARHALALAPTVSLYVNDYNAPARRVYQKLGMRQHATLSTVLL
ncbi:MAG: GNAT family N-acetyltransferase [Jatrophihabitantaceae bacterium]